MSELKQPLFDISTMIDDQSLARVVGFHGHLCPGVAMGVQAAAIALREVGPRSDDAEVVAVVETDMCSVDGIQFLTGCTFGKGNLILLDWGKNAYTFYRRSDGHAVRIAARRGAWNRTHEYTDLFMRVRSGQATVEEKYEFHAIRDRESRRILETPPDRLFTVTQTSGEPPAKTRVFEYADCQACGEETNRGRLRLLGDILLCVPCLEGAPGRV